MTNIQIDSEAVRGIVSRAIVDALDAEQRERVIQQAVQALLEEPKNSYGTKIADSPLVVAFNGAVRQVAADVVRGYLDADEVKSNVRAQIVTQIEKMLNDQGWIYSTIGSAVGERVREIIENGEAR